MKSIRLMSVTVMMNLKSMKPTLETLITKVRIMTLTIKIETITISATAPATWALDTINTNGHNSNTTKNNFQDKPMNVQVTFTGPVNRNQLFKIQEVFRHHHNTVTSYHQMKDQ